MKVVTFGELMVRLQPFNYERFVQANSLEFTFGGGDACLFQHGAVILAVAHSQCGLAGDAQMVGQRQQTLTLSLIHI